MSCRFWMARGAVLGVAMLSPTAAEAQQPDPKVWDNYDFVPGAKVMFYTDFSEDQVGDFARGLKFVGGAMDVVEREGVRMLRATGRSTFLIPLPRKLPERFTLEFDIVARNSNCCAGEELAFEGGRTLDRGPKSVEVLWHHQYAAMLGSGQDMGNSTVRFSEPVQATLIGQLAHIRVMVNGPYFKMYTNERRIYNIPELSFRRDSVIRVLMAGRQEPERIVYLGMIRVAEIEADALFDALTARGRWATQGIHFATGKADLQPESRPVLKQIAATLKEHPDLRIVVEGHTDNVGEAAANLTLSEARAAAVKVALVAGFGIGADRIAAMGFGATTPAVPNTTAAGRAQNRRVEIARP